MQAEVEARPADRRVHVRRVAQQQHPPVAVALGQPRVAADEPAKQVRPSPRGGRIGTGTPSTRSALASISSNVMGAVCSPAVPVSVVVSAGTRPGRSAHTIVPRSVRTYSRGGRLP
ncbi:hypothetical protein ACFQHO_00010 [Actinomadura yumaensis]|uniref:hypothetical protein n=1 Tax=Actinomadura yumaensis TaxID=111807 RepID=UPI00360BD984